MTVGIAVNKTTGTVVGIVAVILTVAEDPVATAIPPVMMVVGPAVETEVGTLVAVTTAADVLALGRTKAVTAGAAGLFAMAAGM